MPKHGTFARFHDQNRYPELEEVLFKAALKGGSILADLNETCRRVLALRLEHGSQKALGFAHDIADSVIEQPDVDMLRRLRDALMCANPLAARPLKLRLDALVALSGDEHEQEKLAFHCLRAAHLQPGAYLSYSIAAHAWMSLSKVLDSSRPERLGRGKRSLEITDDVGVEYVGLFGRAAIVAGERLRIQIAEALR